MDGKGGLVHDARSTDVDGAVGVREQKRGGSDPCFGGGLPTRREISGVSVPHEKIKPEESGSRRGMKMAE